MKTVVRCSQFRVLNREKDIMPHCYVVNCKNYYEKTRGAGKVSYHMPPAAPGVAARWAKACTGSQHTPPKYMRVCSEHFSEKCYLRDLQHELLGLPLRKKLKGDAVPDLNLPAIFKIPMRSSVRIARRETVGCLADLQSPKVKKRNGKLVERERFLRKIKYMRQLKLNFQKNVAATTPKTAEDGLNKMHVMEDVREACDTQPSSPGHAEQRADVAESAPASEDEKNEEETEQQQQQQTSPKRKNCEDDDTPVKKVKNDLQQEFYLRNKILSEYTDSLDMSSFDQIQTQTEQLIAEIQNLADLAKEKEREWNNVIQVKKMKEELLIRIQRQKQVCLLSNGLEISESEPEGDPKQKLLQRRRNEINRQKLMKTLQNNLEMNGHDGKAKQRPVRDVQSIIADYRQRHPETVPRRGRRIRTVNGQDNKNGGVINFANMALGTGSQVRQNNNVFDAQNELGLFLSAMESVDQGEGARHLQSSSDASFKDILVRFAKLSQSERHELLQNVIKPPPPYPEVTVHPVAVAVAASPQHNNSLLHGILTKTQSKQDNKSSFSPTLARLLTAPERSVASQQLQGQVSINNNTTSSNNNRTAANVSISDILNSNKARNEITITPVGGDYEASPKRKNNHTDEEEAEDSVDRLVIDESDDIVDARTDNNSEAGDEVPQCQGCNLKAAQFVCAGCGNQWYCSRECQVSAWDEHSEVCSG